MKFTRKESGVVAEIEVLQSAIPGLRYHDTYQAVSTGPLIPGCAICTRMRHLSIPLGYRCNADCPFCFAGADYSGGPAENEDANRRVMLKKYARCPDDFDGVSFTGGEPLLYLAELEDCIRYIRSIRDDVHLWVYTNGIRADREHCRLLKNMGIGEIRFNLAADNYGEKVLEHCAVAREIFDYVAVEVPSYPEQREKLIGCLDKLDRIGIDQLNLQELLITDANVRRLKGEGYETGLMFAKKFFLYGSRHMTYDVMRLCVERNYAFTVNDCSARRFGFRREQK